MKNNRYLKVVVQLIFILGLGLLAIWVTSLFNRTNSKEEIVKEVTKQIILRRPTCADTSDSFATLPNVILASNLNSYGENGLFVNQKISVVKSVGSGSQVACGYLYVKAHAGSRPLQLKWEHPYVKPSQFGGHIVTDNAILNREIDGKTELLFNLSKIKYWEDNNTPDIRESDWASLLNVSNRVKFVISLNTIDKAGIIDEVSIAYQCWSPETGQKTTDCQLSVENNQ